MKFVVRTPKTQQDDVKVLFWLEEDEDGAISLKAKREDDEDEFSWNVLVINSDGLYRCPAVGDDLGFPVDSDDSDRILLKE